MTLAAFIRFLTNSSHLTVPNQRETSQQISEDLSTLEAETMGSVCYLDALAFYVNYN